MKNTILIIIGVVVIILVLVFLLPSNDDNTSSKPSSSDVSVDEPNESVEEEDFDKTPDFSLEDYDGNTVTLSDLRGKVAVVNSWATWCPFCVNELSDFAALQEEFGDEIVVIAIDRSESLSKAKGFTDDLGVTDKFTFLLDGNDSFYRSIGGFSMPETLFLDGNGNIRIHKRGPMELEEMRDKVLEILSTKS